MTSAYRLIQPFRESCTKYFNISLWFPMQLILAATEQFNIKPKQGITFLQERGIIAASSSPEFAEEVASFLVDNPRLNKAMIGEYIGDRKNPAVLEAFVK